MKRLHHELTAQLCQALASPTRLHTLTLLAQGWWNVGQLAEELGESTAMVSAHLKVLRSAHLISVEKRGREVRSRISSPQVISTLATVQQAAESILPELREAVGNAKADPLVWEESDLSRIAAEAEAERLTLLDLRPEAEYLEGHLPRAISRPFNTLSQLDLGELMPSRHTDLIIGYCRGPWCKRARDGVRLLNDRGVPARRLRAGVIEWRAAGLALEK